ncbi:MAG: 50S ribosomal protein L4, partial [Puniceicoccaceae bacterium TMED149]
VDDAFEKNAALAARNIEGISLSESSDLSVLEIVKFRNLIVSTKAIETLIARANGAQSEGSES